MRPRRRSIRFNAVAMRTSSSARADPPSLDDVLNAARALGPQPGIPWPRARWAEAFPQHRRLLDQLPELLTREAVRAVCAQQPPTPQGALAGFVACMAWGHGTTGYGVHRTVQVLDLAGAEAGVRLASARQAVMDHGALAGYDALAGTSRLIRLGPAFGTKFLFYQNEQALILDRLSGRWFKSVTDISLRPTVWRHDKYAVYLEHIQEWAARDDLSPASVEQAAFQLMSEREGNQWAA